MTPKTKTVFDRRGRCRRIYSDTTGRWRSFQEDPTAATDARQALVDQLEGLGVTVTDDSIPEEVLQQLLDLLQRGGGAAAAPVAPAASDAAPMSERRFAERAAPARLTWADMSAYERRLASATRAGKVLQREYEQQRRQHAAFAESLGDVLARARR